MNRRGFLTAVLVAPFAGFLPKVYWLGDTGLWFTHVKVTQPGYLTDIHWSYDSSPAMATGVWKKRL